MTVIKKTLLLFNIARHLSFKKFRSNWKKSNIKLFMNHDLYFLLLLKMIIEIIIFLLVFIILLYKKNIVNLK